MSVEQMRNFIIKYYPGSGWRNKVKIMSDEQVMAIYYKFISRKEPVKTKLEGTTYTQMVMDEVLL